MPEMRCFTLKWGSRRDVSLIYAVKSIWKDVLYINDTYSALIVQTTIRCLLSIVLLCEYSNSLSSTQRIFEFPWLWDPVFTKTSTCAHCKLKRVPAAQFSILIKYRLNLVFEQRENRHKLLRSVSKRWTIYNIPREKIHKNIWIDYHVFFIIKQSVLCFCFCGKSSLFFDIW